jgi:hypothetical protein
MRQRDRIEATSVVRVDVIDPAEHIPHWDRQKKKQRESKAARGEGRDEVSLRGTEDVARARGRGGGDGALICELPRPAHCMHQDGSHGRPQDMRGGHLRDGRRKDHEGRRRGLGEIC